VTVADLKAVAELADAYELDPAKRYVLRVATDVTAPMIQALMDLLNSHGFEKVVCVRCKDKYDIEVLEWPKT
jgi:hypothetical protein